MPTSLNTILKLRFRDAWDSNHTCVGENRLHLSKPLSFSRAMNILKNIFLKFLRLGILLEHPCGGANFTVGAAGKGRGGFS